METLEKKTDQHWMRKFIPIWSAQIFSLLGSGLVQFCSGLVDHAENGFRSFAGYRHTRSSLTRSVPCAICGCPC